MKRSHYILLAVLLTNALSSGPAMACDAGGGGYRLSYRPAIRYAPLYRQIVVHRQVVPSIRTVNVSDRSRLDAAAPSIRLAPSQLRAADRPIPDSGEPNPPSTPSPPNVPSSTPNAENVTPDADAPDALSMLAGGSTEAAPVEPDSNHIGVWQANASTKATVTLRLNSDNSFEWLAENDGQESRFAGNFQLEGDKLVLTRSSDNLKLNGKVSFSGNTFNFKLDGAQDAGLNFSRQ